MDTDQNIPDHFSKWAAELAVQHKGSDYRLMAAMCLDIANMMPLGSDSARMMDLALRLPPAMRLPVTAPRMTWTADRPRIVIHHLTKGLHARRQAKQPRSSPKCSPEPPASTLSSERQWM
jgi:hypothetical protein